MLSQLKTVLCGTDFSESSYHALDFALDFAKNADGTLVVAHVIHVPAGDLFEAGHPTAGALNFGEAKKWSVERMKEVHEKRLGGYPKTELLAVIGDPSTEILEIAKSRPVDLIVTSTHGRSGLAHLLLGSVAEKIIRHAPCPVFVVRSGAE